MAICFCYYLDLKLVLHCVRYLQFPNYKESKEKKATDIKERFKMREKALSLTNLTLFCVKNYER